MIEDQIIFKYPEQKFVGLATRRRDNSLNHFAFALVNTVPALGETIRDRNVIELLTDEKLLQELTVRARVDKIAVVAVLANEDQVR